MYASSVQLDRMSVHNQIESVRAMAEAIKQICSVKFPWLEIPLEKRGSNPAAHDKHSEVTIKNSTLDVVDVDGIDAWWSAWCEVRNILNNVSEANVEGGRDATLGPIDLYARMRLDDEWIRLTVDIYSTGEKHIIAEYTTSESGGMLYDGHTIASVPDESDLEPDLLDEIELGRAVAEAEQRILIEVTESAAETIDYWHTEVSPDSIGFSTTSQSKWADVRGVGRQTVNDRVRSTSDKIDD